MLDVTSDDSVARCLEEVGPLDAIVNNAAIFGGGPVEGYPLDRIRQMFETNTLGALRVIQAVLPAWRKRGSGVISQKWTSNRTEKVAAHFRGGAWPQHEWTEVVRLFNSK